MITRMGALVVLLIILAHDAPPLWAHPGGHVHDASDPQVKRTWTSASSGDHWHGAFVAAKDGRLQIRCDDETLVSVPIQQLTASDQHWIADRLAAISRANTQPTLYLTAQQSTRPTAEQESTARPAAPAIVRHFQPFEKTLQLRWDERYLYVGSNGMPDHPLMVGIRAWQQQVPIPQKYFGDNAWRIPLHPRPAKEPRSAKNNFLRGAIALAVNGVPIFNPLNNRGDDAYLFGELDEHGGHCGRADDYHYHIAPVHLEKFTGKDQPIAYALDGYPIYGYQNEGSPDFAPLDALNGHKDKSGNYHYHATKTYPYLNGGFYGEVSEREGQVDPQPRAEPLRPSLPPLRDARITEFSAIKPGSYRLVYDVRGKKGSVSYTLAENGSAQFIFVTPNGQTTTETYTPRRRGPDSNDRPPPPRSGEDPPPRKNQRSPPRNSSTSTRNVERSPATTAGNASAAAPNNLPRLTVTSTSLTERGFLASDCTCDGAGQSPAIQWKGAPAGTKCYAISLWHTAPDQEKSYWLVYNIPTSATGLKQNSRGVGQVGLNDKRRAEYDPMCSKGPGVKRYHVTVYALSTELSLAPDKATRASLLAAVKDVTLATGTLDFQYERRQ